MSKHTDVLARLDELNDKLDFIMGRVCAFPVPDAVGFEQVFPKLPENIAGEYCDRQGNTFTLHPLEG